MTTPESLLTRLEASLREVLRAAGPVDYEGRLHPVDAVAVYRVLLGRSPDLLGEIPSILEHAPTLSVLLTSVLDSEELAGRTGFFPPRRLLMAEVEGFRFWFHTSDRAMGVPMALGRYERHQVGVMKRLLRPGMRCLDIGAHSGFYTCLMASLVGPAGHVYAFEPKPENWDLLARNVRENGFQGHVMARRLACTDVTSTIRVARLADRYVVGHIDGVESLIVAAVRIDEVVRTPVDVVKINVDGHEPAVIRGMERLIRAHRPAIVSAVGDGRQPAGFDTDAYVAQLNALGYDVFDAQRLDAPLQGGTTGSAVVGLVALPAGDSRNAELR